jgi:hypothetical protein
MVISRSFIVAGNFIPLQKGMARGQYRWNSAGGILEGKGMTEELCWWEMGREGGMPGGRGLVENE